MGIDNTDGVLRALKLFPYFVLSKEIGTGYSWYKDEIRKIQQYYNVYRHGADFAPEGTRGDYVPTLLRIKQASSLINKEARFMFSNSPDINIMAMNVDDDDKLEQYNRLILNVLTDKRNNFYKYLLLSSKDCFVGGRVACLVDYSEDYGIQIHFYNALQFYYETEYGTERLTKFVSFERVTNSKALTENCYIVTRYSVTDVGKVAVSQTLYNGVGKVLEQMVKETVTELESIPAVVIVNDGTLEDKRGVSEIESLVDYESAYSMLNGADMDSERKGMNPVWYTIDMNPRSTVNLSSGPGAYWDLQHNTNINEPSPGVGVLSPSMNHTEPLKTTLERIRANMYGEVDVPDVTQEGALGGVTSYKALRALYFPLTVRCNEKMKTWSPAIEEIVEHIITLAKLNIEDCKSRYMITGLENVEYNISVIPNYALLADEDEEKSVDLQEIATNSRSRKSYIKKWRKDEFKTDAQIDDELMQIATEINMFDTLSMNTQVQNSLDETELEEQIDKNVEEEEKNKFIIFQKSIDK